jgi:hypothetical protein
MTTTDWAQLALAIAAIVSTVAAGVRWLVKHYLNELKPNSGSSLRDSVDRLETQMELVIRMLTKDSNERDKEANHSPGGRFYVSALATIGAGSLFGVPAATAAGIAGLLAVAKVGESLAKAYIADGKLSKDEVESAFNESKGKK